MISIVVISKNDSALEKTLVALRREQYSVNPPAEVIVVDASDKPRAALADLDPGVRWLDYPATSSRQVTIPHQRNVGVRDAKGQIVVFIDSGCVPHRGWLKALIAPIVGGTELVTAGTTLSVGKPSVYQRDALQRSRELKYLDECPTINMAFERTVYEAVGGFDESFDYGSDIDFTWRLNDSGYRIRLTPEAVIEHDWGVWRRQLKRSYWYGRGRCRLYKKHAGRRRSILRRDPVAALYPIFLLGLPLARRKPLYPLLLLIPIYRNWGNGGVRTVVDHLAYGAGVLFELSR